MSDPLWPHELQHTRVPCPSLSPRVCSDSCLLSWWCYSPIPSLHLPSIFPSRVVSNESAFCIRCPKYWSFSFSISPSNDYSGLTFFRIDCFGLLAIQGTLRSLVQHHSLKGSILQRSAFFMVQLSHLYMSTGKTIALTRWSFAAKWCLYFFIRCLGLS